MSLPELTAMVSRITVRQTASEALYLVRLSHDLQVALESGDAGGAGSAAGRMLASALRLLDDGAAVRDVRALIELGKRRS